MLNTEKRVSYLTLTTLTFFLAACAPPPDGGKSVVDEPGLAATASEVAPVWEAADGMETPESVYFDADSGFIFVSQIAGDPADRDGNGRIVQLSRSGEVLADSWVTGLNAPKGLRSHDGILWTADIDEIIGIDIATAAIVSSVTVEGAQFLRGPRGPRLLDGAARYGGQYRRPGRHDPHTDGGAGDLVQGRHGGARRIRHRSRPGNHAQ